MTCYWSNVFTLVLFVYIGVFVTASGTYSYFPVTAYTSKICSKECKQWKPKHCWDGYLKRKVWKMVCESFDQKCCPGYEGPNCESDCFNCEKIHGFERRFIDVYSKIQTVEATCTNITQGGGHTGGTEGSGGGDETGGKIVQCECPAGARGDRGHQGLIGPPGQPGPTGPQGPQGPPGQTGREGPAGPQGLDGAPGPIGRDGRRGLPGERGDAGPGGAPGLSGMTGPVGEKGNSGVDGLPGTAAEKGDAGPMGPQGPEGRRGHTGQKGEPGLIGFPGMTGDSGVDGRNGRDGSLGEKGDIGPPGIPGADGRPGARGLSGEPGPPGAAGDQGIPGFNGRKGDRGQDGRPGEITRVEESTLIKEMLNTIQSLTRRLETTTNEVNELRVICDKIISCRFNCTSDSFMCSCGMCIPQKYQCDGFPQCPDGSDEDPRSCGLICTTAEFKCETTGMCIPLALKCNGRPDCPDDSDESVKYCKTISCTEGDVPCRDGSKCVAREERCDGKADCTDGSDEESCVCRPDEFECYSGSPECIPLSSTCDSFPNCEDQSDETIERCKEDRGVICMEGQQPCADKLHCINPDQVCDRYQDCEDGSDELNCGTTKVTPLEIVTTTTSTTSATTTHISTTTTAPSTTTTAPPTTTEAAHTTTAKRVLPTDDDEMVDPGSGMSCQELYDAWVDPTFPGGPPPPLSPDETINEELCAYLRSHGLPNMEDKRQKRHKTDDTFEDVSDAKFRDAELEAETEAANIDDMSDIAFADSSEDDSKSYTVEFAPKPAAVVGNDTNGSPRNVKSVWITASSALILVLLLI